MTWGVAFALTQAIEVPIYWLGTRRAPLAPAWRLAVGFGASALTHPIVFFVLRAWLEPRLGYWAYLVLAEAFAVIVEGLYLRAFDVPRPWLLALVANGTSVTTGLGLWWLGLL